MVQASLPARNSPANAGTAAAPPTEQLADMTERLDEIADTGHSMQPLLEAMLAVASGLELESTLRRIVSTATALVHARYGALEVQGTDTSVVRFVHVGDALSSEHTSDPPQGHGLLGQLINDPTPLRLPDHDRYPRSGGFPPNHTPMRSFLGVLVRVGSEVYGKLYLTERDTGTFTANDEVVVQALAAAAGIAVHNARLFEESVRRQHRLEAASEIASELLTGSTAPRVLQVVAQRAMELCVANAAFIVLADPESGADGSRIGGHAGLTVEQVAILAAGDDHSTEAISARLPGFGPSMTVPLRSEGKTVGAIVALRLSDGVPFRSDELPLLASFADQASIVLEVAAKQRAKRQLDIFSDRDRIARDLHDHVIQRLFAAGMNLQGLLPRADDPEVQERIRYTVDQLDQTVREIRTSIFDLHTPAGTAPMSLRRRLLDTIAEVTAGSRLSPSIRIDGPVDTVVPARLSDHADAVLREAITNVVRHARASRLEVAIKATDHLTIEVEDDGVGLVIGARRSGLRNLEERAGQCGGTCELTTSDGGGTVLRWRAPIRS